ncbi:ComEC/Rec2 family competence protein [Flavobacterium algicola]|uniref:ComEC/Rec2 family competence protein n=1 Tax=Flavobacterium algicola TaxID=556529 RepID=UPI001EFEC934|nr:ComEC/Rec2 family competence protein [Flavobacterium algicola]MCG9794125.1 ComEC family competence protein [Flavobacterium algicola]
MKILHFPLTKITLGFLLGILFAYNIKVEYSLGFSFLLFAFLLFIISYYTQIKVGKGNLLFGLASCFISFTIGMTTLNAHTETYQKEHYSHFDINFDSENYIAATIKERIKSTEKNDRYIISLAQINGHKNSGKVLLNLQKDKSNSSLIVGNHIFVKGKIIRNKPPYNPSLFDYSRYLENKQIYGQLYSKYESLKVSTLIEKDLFYYCSKLTTTILHNLEKSHFDPQSLSVAMALILGQKQDLSSAVLHDYQYAGAIHILSVSGLHIGFILIFLNFILSPIPNTKKGSLIKLLLSIALLFLFAIIAGLSPSVIRSVVMFSFIALGYYLRRSTYIYHTIIVSILLILFFQPYFLFDAGFQLSYLAVFSIIWIQPLLANIWKPKSKVLQFCWNIFTVSVAAQIGTLPLSLFYFHQFPGLFFVTNLLILPFLSIIMILGIVVMLLAAFNFTPLLLIKIFDWSIYGMNSVINEIASLHYFVLKDIPFNNYLLLSSYLLIITIIVWFKKPKFSKLIWIFIAIIGLQLSYIKTTYENQVGQEWQIFNQQKNSLITERKGDLVIAYTNDTITNLTSNLNLQGYLVSHFSALNRRSPLLNVAYFNKNKILIIDSLGIYPANCRPDILVLTQSPKINLDRLLPILHPKIVIADGTNFKNIQQNWKLSCKKQNIPFHATAEKGYYKL